jgi:hypothetical protein
MQRAFLWAAATYETAGWSRRPGSRLSRSWNRSSMSICAALSSTSRPA